MHRWHPARAFWARAFEPPHLAPGAPSRACTIAWHLPAPRHFVTVKQNVTGKSFTFNDPPRGVVKMAGPKKNAFRLHGARVKTGLRILELREARREGFQINVGNELSPCVFFSGSPAGGIRRLKKTFLGVPL